MRFVLPTLALLLAGMPKARAGEQPAPSRGDIEFFEAKVRPVLAERCFKCHSSQAKNPKGNLRLDSRANILKGGDSGRAAVASQPDKSLLLRAVGYKDADLAMPPQGKLPDHEIAALTEWVRRGLPYPGAAKAAIENKSAVNIDEGRKFWSFQPVRALPAPSVKQFGWVQRPIDAFILAELEKQGLAPSPAASPRTLIRRLYFDVIGLPPSPEEVESFISDCDPSIVDFNDQSIIKNQKLKIQSAVRRVVDRLLASPRYGERWGRYWLDLARYCDIAEPWAEIKGQPWRYRDWVVRAFDA